MRKFGSPPHLNPECEHVCGVLGPLSRKVTLGGHPLVPFSCRICLHLFFSTPHLSSRVSPSSSLSNSLPRPAGKSLQHFGPEAVSRRWAHQVAETAAPAPGSTARVQAASLSSDTTALLPARGSPPRVSRQRCPPCACRLSADSGSVLWVSGNSCNVQNTENRVIT